LFPRELPEPFAAARADLEPVLEAVGFRLAGESYHPEAFGSASADYRQRGRRLRLIWDGKDRWLWLEASPAGNDHPTAADYRDVEKLVGRAPAGFAVEADLIQERLMQLRAALQELLKAN